MVVIWMIHFETEWTEKKNNSFDLSWVPQYCILLLYKIDLDRSQSPPKLSEYKPPPWEW